MANDLNQCAFIGRLGQDPEVRYSAQGTAFANISLAVGKSWKDRTTGQKQERTTWVPVVFTGKLAEVVGQYLKKGSKIFVSGEFNVRKWQDQNGNDRYNTEVVVGMTGRMQMLDGRPDGAAPSPAPQQQPRPAPQQGYQAPAQQTDGSPPPQAQNNTAPAGGGFDDFDDDIPFAPAGKCSPYRGAELVI